jgi:CheY-like chemotaxis protein
MTELFDQRKARSETRILIADDDMFMRSVIKRTLNGVGEMIEDERGDNVMKLYQEHLPDVVLLDIHMPGKQGFDLLKEIAGVRPDRLYRDDQLGRHQAKTSCAASMRAPRVLSASPSTATVLKKYVQFCETVRNGENMASRNWPPPKACCRPRLKQALPRNYRSSLAPMG